MAAKGDVCRAVLWQRIDEPGIEYCILSSVSDGWMLEGTVVQAIEGAPTEVRYRIECDGKWSTRRVRVAVHSGKDERALELLADGEGGWELEKLPLSELEGCLDVDLSVTPATNALPVRRLGLAPGESRRVSATWVRFPSLSIERLEQSYAHLEEGLYRYESWKGSDVFAAELKVDDLGLVVSYESGWKRVATADASAPISIQGIRRGRFF